MFRLFVYLRCRTVYRRSALLQRLTDRVSADIIVRCICIVETCFKQTANWISAPLVSIVGRSTAANDRTGRPPKYIRPLLSSMADGRQNTAFQPMPFVEPLPFRRSSATVWTWRIELRHEHWHARWLHHACDRSRLLGSTWRRARARPATESFVSSTGHVWSTRCTSTDHPRRYVAPFVPRASDDGSVDRRLINSIVK